MKTIVLLICSVFPCLFGDDYKYMKHHLENNVADVQLYPFGTKYGDIMTEVEDAPTLFKTSRSIPFRKTQFKELKVYQDGVVELQKDGLSWKPQFAIFGLLYSKVANGTIWFSQSTDREILTETAQEIKKYFEGCSHRFKPKMLTVITWQNFQTISVYPETDKDSPDYNEEFADCLEYSLHDRSYTLRCECVHLHGYSWDECHYINFIPNFPGADCYRNFRWYHYGSGAFSFNNEVYCYCISRGFEHWVSVRAASFTYMVSPYYGATIFACEVSQCITNGRHWKECLCFTTGSPPDHFVDPCNYCFDLSGEDYFYAVNTEKACRCLLPPDEYWTYEYFNASAVRLQNYKTYCRCLFDWSGMDWETIQQDFPVDACNCLLHMNKKGQHDFLVKHMSKVCDCAQNNIQYQDLCQNTKRAANGNYNQNALNVRDIAPGRPYLWNTVQMAIAHNKNEAYVIYNYKVVENINANTFVRVGYVDQDNQFTGYNHPYPTSLTMFLHLLWKTNVGERGRWIYKVDGDSIIGPGCEETVSGKV